MSYLVLARKYRPQTFDQVVKQDHVSRTLTNAISTGRVAHAILFSGPRGTGKTTVARIMAKAMNCEVGPTSVPCNECRSCREITAGRSMDVFEIDGASNNSVDQIRELRENVKYSPAYSLYKIYIIDEVHMLSMAAFNALLKTLEEPPSHVMFIFATTEPHKIPITILSRCQRHDFKLIDVESIIRHLEGLCIKEGIDIDAESLGLLARQGAGSMRDALSLLDLVMSTTAGTITNQQILDILGVVDRKVIFDLAAALFGGDIAQVLEIVDELYRSGYDMKKLYADLVEHFRNLVVVKMGEKASKLVDIPAHEINLMIEQVNDVPGAFLNQVFDLLFTEETTLGHSSQPKLAMEMIFMRLHQIKPALPIDELIEKLDNLRKDIYETRPVDSDIETEPANRGASTDSKGTLSEAEATAEHTAPYAAATFDVNQKIDEIWQKILSIFSEKHPSLAANLKNAILKNLTDRSLEIEIRGNGFNISMIRRHKNVAIIKKVCNDFFGKEMDVRITAKQNSSAENQREKSLAESMKKDALGHHLVADAVEIFNGKVVDVKIL
jgi:DNA polymerase-3 subunit gamma/tau